jgi:hypothetical protein
VKGGRRSGHAKDRAIPKFIRQVDRESVTCALRGACLGSPLQNPGQSLHAFGPLLQNHGACIRCIPT